jgi:hypothetical protein
MQSVMNSTELTDTTNSTTVEPPPDSVDTPKAKCTKGATGYAIVWKPTYRSIVYLDMNFNVTWDYTTTVTKKPQFVDAYVQSQKPGVKVDWTTQVASRVPADKRWFWWKPEAIPEGSYKFMIVPDGKKLAGVRADAFPCFENGEAEPGVSQEFQILKLTNTNVPDNEIDTNTSPSNGASGPCLLSLWLPILVLILYMFNK